MNTLLTAFGLKNSPPLNETIAQPSTNTGINNNNKRIIKNNKSPNKTPIKNNKLPSNIIPTNIINKDRYHFFLGSMLNDKISSQLKGLQNYLRKDKFKLKDTYWSNFYIKVLYLGYFDLVTAHKLMNILNPILISIAGKFKALTCKFNGVLTFKGKESKYKRFVLKIENNYLNNNIIPLIIKLVLNKIYPNYDKLDNDSQVNVISFKERDTYSDLRDLLKTVRVPEEEFTLNHISLLKGQPIDRKTSGVLSKEDRIIIDEMGKFIYPFTGTL